MGKRAEAKFTIPAAGLSLALGAGLVLSRDRIDIAEPDHAPEPGPYYPAPAPIWAAAAGTAVASNTVFTEIRAFGDRLMAAGSPYRLVMSTLPRIEFGNEDLDEAFEKPDQRRTERAESRSKRARSSRDMHER